MTLSPRVPSSRWFQWHSRCTWVELPSSFCDTDVTCGEITQHIQLQRGLLSPGGKQQLKCWQWSAARDPCLRVLSLIGLSGGREEEPRAMIWPLITLNKEPELLLYTGSHSEKVEGYHFKQERPCSAGQGDKGGGEKYGCQWPPIPTQPVQTPYLKSQEWSHQRSSTQHRRSWRKGGGPRDTLFFFFFMKGLFRETYIVVSCSEREAWFFGSYSSSGGISHP